MSNIFVQKIVAHRRPPHHRDHNIRADAESLPRLGAPAYSPFMPARKPRPADSKSQSERFIETARALGCDENEAAFKAKLAVIARQKPARVALTTQTTGREAKKPPISG